MSAGWRQALSLVLVTVLSLTLTASAALGGDEGFSVSLTKAVDLAIGNSSAVQLADLAIQRAEIVFDERQDAADNLPRTYVQSLETKKFKDLYPRQAESALEIAREGKVEARRQTAFAVRAAYFQVLMAREMVKVNERALERAGKQLALARAGLKAGTVSPNEVMGAEVRQVSAESALATSKKNLQVASMNLNKIMGFPLMTSIELASEVSFEPLKEVDVEAGVAEALTKRFEIFKARQELDIKELELEYTDEYRESTHQDYRLAEIAAREAAAKLAEETAKIEVEVRTAYLDMLDAESKVDVSRRSAELAGKNLELAEARYRAGAGTSYDVLNAQVTLAEAEVQAVKALYDYELAKARFELSLGR